MRQETTTHMANSRLKGKSLLIFLAAVATKMDKSDAGNSSVGGLCIFYLWNLLTSDVFHVQFPSVVVYLV